MVGHLLPQRRKRGRPRIEHQSLGDTEKKWCGGCKAWLELGAFRASSVKWDGLQIHCAACMHLSRRKTRMRTAASNAKRSFPDDMLKRCSTCRVEGVTRSTVMGWGLRPQKRGGPIVYRDRLLKPKVTKPN